MNTQLDKIRRAYDLTVGQHARGLDSLTTVPEYIQHMPGYRQILNDPSTGSGAPDIKEYLKPETGMRFLDVGSCANLANYRLDKWPSIYYGIDISSALISAMQSFVAKNKITIGGLYNTDLASVAFPDDFFDIAAGIGTIEYWTLQYTERALHELSRVLKPAARVVLDIPNLGHPHVETMFRLEEHLGRPNIPKTRSVIERVLQYLFCVERVSDSGIMIKYFLQLRMK